MSLQLPSRKFYFIRHGETDFNRLNHFQGQTDVPLNETGRSQAKNRRDLVAKLPLNHIFSSPLSRALDTAKLLVGTRDIEVVEDLKECGWPETTAQIYRDLGLGIPDFTKATTIVKESRVEFLERSVGAVVEVLEKSQDTPLVVAHGGTYWALCQQVGVTPGRIPNCTPVLFLPNGESWDVQVGVTTC